MSVSARNFCAACVLTFVLASCGREKSDLIQGYVEGEYVYVASPLPGQLEKLGVKRGDDIKPGTLLFQLDSTPEKAAVEEASRRLAQAKATLEDAGKGRRPTELASLEAQLGQAQAAMLLSERELARQEQLSSTGATSKEDRDRALSLHVQNKQRVAQLQADLETARLGLRVDQVAAAEAEVKARAAALSKAEWDLSQKQQSSMRGGTIFDTLYREGEWVPAGRPVVALLPPQNVKVRAFVPEPRLSEVHQGDRLSVSIDGVAQPVTGTVSFISPQAEHTPPVIYSRESRSKLVFMIELVFEPSVAATLHPGQPVDVQLK